MMINFFFFLVENNLMAFDDNDDYVMSLMNGQIEFRMISFIRNSFGIRFCNSGIQTNIFSFAIFL